MPMPHADVAAACDALLGPYRAAFPGARWQRPDAFHVTLRFLGATPPERVDGWSQPMMARCAADGRPFRLATDGGDGVVRRSGGVAWLRIDRGAAQAADLSGVPARTPSAATRRPRPVQRAPPALTVARRVDRALIDALADASLGGAGGRAGSPDRMVLYRSHTGTPAGSSYEPLAEVRL